MTAIRRLLAVPAAAAALALAGGAVAAAPASAQEAGTAPLAAVLTADGDRFDRDWRDYDVVTEAVLAVLAAKPDSPVGLLTQGEVALTAFIPNDRAFQVLVADLTRRVPLSEQRAFEAVAGLGIDTVEQVLLYHVVPGATIDSATALRSDGVALTTAQGGTVTVDVLSRQFGLARLVDADRNDVNPFLLPGQLDLNGGNAQIAHGISFVLRPVDLR